MLALLKKNMVVIGVIVAAVVALYFYSSSSGGGAILTSSMEAESPVSHEILATLGNLRTIRLDDSIFKDPLFMSLSDFGVTIPPAAAGRRNPFAPVGQGGSVPRAATGTTTAGTTTPAR